MASKMGIHVDLPTVSTTKGCRGSGSGKGRNGKWIDLLKIWLGSFLFYKIMAIFERIIRILNKIVSLKLTAWPMKMDGWKMIHFLWGPPYFPGAFAVSLSGGFPHIKQAKWIDLNLFKVKALHEFGRHVRVWKEFRKKNAAHKKLHDNKSTWKNWRCLIGTWNNMWLSHLCCSISPFLLHMLHTLILRQCSWRHHVQLVFQFFWVFQVVLFSMGETLNYVYFMILACWEDFISWLLKKLVTFSWPFVFVVAGGSRNDPAGF